MLGILHLQEPDLLTYWIDGDGENLLLLTRKYGMDIPMQDWNRLNGWKGKL